MAVTVTSFEIYGWKFTGYLYSLLVPAAVIFPKQIICVYKKLIALPNWKAKCFARWWFSIWNFACNTQDTFFFDTSCYFVIYRQFQNASQKYNYRLHFFSPSPILTDLLGNMCFLQRGSKGHVCRSFIGWFQSMSFISFCGNYDWQLTFSQCTVIFL